jgi:hypothetical protein
MTLLSTDPLVFARDENNDLIIPRRKVSGLEAIAILVRTAWLLWRDEWFLNRDIGTPWLETADGAVTERDAILGQAFDPTKVARALRTEAVAIRGVRDVVQIKTSFDAETRNMEVSGVVRSDFGDVTVSTAIAA